MISESLRAALVALVRAVARFDDPGSPSDLLALLRLLYETGRRDLPLGRLFEGHVDALQLIHRYGSPAQSTRTASAVRTGDAIFGVWNADLPADPLVIAPGGLILNGGKSFASGAGLISHALVSVDLEGQRQLVLVDLARVPPDIDRSWWRVVGMQRSETHIVRWHEAQLGADDLIGEPGDYVREPWFSGGALRFAAVQAGGVASICDQVADHLVMIGRAGDPHQSGRLAALYLAAQSAAGAVRHAAERWFDGSDAEKLALVSAARVAVYAAGEHALTLAQQAVGVQALFVNHPLSRTITDLTVYLRQPAPDAQRMRVGAAVAAGMLRPQL